LKTAGTAPPPDWVRGMFGRIAPNYDRLNHLLSFNQDKRWRRRTVERLRPILQREDARVLDLCCGTGDLALELAGRRAQVFASDFCHPMLTTARGKGCARLFEADALTLPLAPASFDAVTVAFGFRNLANYRQGLAELLRVLKPGGTLAILEFSTPPSALFRAGYQAYSRWVLPRVGGWISGMPEAYTYLPESVRKFPAAPELAAGMRETGFVGVEFERMMFGVVALHVGQAPKCPPGC